MPNLPRRQHDDEPGPEIDEGLVDEEHVEQGEQPPDETTDPTPADEQETDAP